MKTNADGSVTLSPMEYSELLENATGKLRTEFQFKILNCRNGEIIRCPVCDRNNGRYVRKINLGQVFFMYELYQQYRLTGSIWHRYDKIQKIVERKYNKKCTDYSKLCLLKLLTPKNEHSDDGNSSGYFSLTKLGAAFVNNEVEIPEYTIQTSEGTILETSTELISIRDFMGNPETFHYLRNINQEDSQTIV
jgi:hypothetical protein